MIALLALAGLLLGPAIGGALALHLWQTRPPRMTHSGYTVGQIPLRLHKRNQAQRLD